MCFLFEAFLACIVIECFEIEFFFYALDQGVFISTRVPDLLKKVSLLLLADLHRNTLISIDELMTDSSFKLRWIQEQTLYAWLVQLGLGSVTNVQISLA